MTTKPSAGSSDGLRGKTRPESTESCNLRDSEAEAGLIRTDIRVAGWDVTSRLPLDALTTYEPRAAFKAILELRTAGKDVSLEGVAELSGVPLRVLRSFPWDADVPGLVRRLVDLHRRRQLVLFADAAQFAARDFTRDPRDCIKRLRAALKGISA